MTSIAPATGNSPALPAVMGAPASSDPSAPALPIAALTPVGQKPATRLPNLPSAPARVSFAATLQQKLKLLSADRATSQKHGPETPKADVADPRSLAAATQGLLEKLAAATKEKTSASTSSIAGEEQSVPVANGAAAPVALALPAATDAAPPVADVPASDPPQSAPLALNVAIPASAQTAMPTAKTPTSPASRQETFASATGLERQASAGTGSTVAQGGDVPVKAVPGSAAPANPVPTGEATEPNAPTAEMAPAPTAASTPAILAADVEKSSAGANTINKDSTGFQDVLNNHLIQAQPTQNHVPTPAADIPVRPVATPVAAADWANDVGNQLSWMASKGESRADLVLNPPQMGRIEVSISISGDQASASFVSTNPEVRNVLQDSMHRLREVLADSGVFLGQANIGAESFSQGQNPQEKGGKSPDDSFSSGSQSLLGSASRPLSISPAATRQGRGLIDLFA